MDAFARDRIERLTVRCRGPATAAATAPALRLRAERHLAALDWRPPGLPPAAVLVVQRVAGPGLQTDRPLPSPEWRERVQRQVADLYRRAVRPASAAVPPNAAAVLFSDEAELVACLTADVLAGRAAERWYWRALWPTLPAQPGEALAHAWCSRPAALPPGLGLLSDRDAAQAVALLDRRQVSQVVRALHDCFALLPTALQVQLEERPAPLQQPLARPAPWQRWLPEEAVAGLSPQATYLLGLAAALRCAPTQARSQAFAAAAAGWLRTALAAEHPWPGAPGARARASSVAASPPTAAVSRGSPSVLPQASAQGAVASCGLQGAPDASGEATAGPAVAADRLTVLPAAVAERASTAEPARGSYRLPAAADAGLADAIPEAAGLEAADRLALPDWPGQWTATGLGGALYLINLLLRLDLPDGWSDPALAEHVGGWALLEALARALLATTQSGQLSQNWPSALADDPLWSVLAALDGRPVGEAIGADLPPPVAFRLPATWLLRYGPAEPRWLAAALAGRLLLWAADADGQGGYLVADVPLDDQGLAEAAAAEAARYAAAGLAARWDVTATPPALPHLDSSTAALFGPGLAWLVPRLLGFLRCWLARALACPPAELGDRLAELLAAEGRLLVSRTHVDLFLPMDRIHISARRAGLDRNPGWVPNLGRIVSFHFV